MTRVQATVNFGATDTEKSFTISECGILNSYVLVIPNWTTGSPTTTLSIQDDQSAVIYTGTGQNENGTRVVTGLAIPVWRDGSCKLTLSGQPGGADHVHATLYIEERK